ncbi:MAG: FHA domain-containing protein [Muribaculaceae bacterium]|nr:FHA domain-containing protein [Muribaculaceae bacterium]
MAEEGKITVTCKKCGRTFQCKSPLAPGNYSVTCVNPECKSKVSFKYPIASPQQSKPRSEVKYGRLEDGSYRFRCENNDCRQSILVPPNMVKSGHNKVKCPKCSVLHEFDIEPEEKDLLRCQMADCKGILAKPDRGDGVYSSVCNECGQEYALIVKEGKVVKVTMKTPLPPSSSRKFDLELVLGRFIGKKKYPLSKGIHYVGREDNENKSDFDVKDKYASGRSLRIDVNENGGSLVYKMTVERAMNPVYHNNKELTVGDIVYLTYGDTIKLGKTLIKVQKIPK